MSIAREFGAGYMSMLRPMPLARLTRVLVCVLAFTSACGDAPTGRRDLQEAGGEISAGVVDWNRRAIAFRSPGWTFEFCEGEGPFLCVARGNAHVGSVELLRLPVDRHSTITEVLDRGGSEVEALKAAAAEFVATLSADRRVGLGENYRLHAEPPAEATVMGTTGLRVVVEGGVADQVDERVVQYYVIHRDSLYLLTATGSAGGGPLGEFATGDLRAFEPLFSEIAAVSRVSDSTQVR
ncbi:MAG TPA: hypothetical protein VK912_01900 [Longimicrobiales bacterium]|nr:hypothetical protein [Longimicrobiales bacterium]